MATTAAGPALRRLVAGQRDLGALGQAVATIGDRYVDENALDDTGMQLTMAEAKAKQGDLAGAAKLKAQVVKARLPQR